MPPTAGGTATRTLRELGEAFGTWPFRVALLLSLLVHACLLLLLRSAAAGGAAERRALMRVQILRQAPAAAEAPALPAAPGPRRGP